MNDENRSIKNLPLRNNVSSIYEIGLNITLLSNNWKLQLKICSSHETEYTMNRMTQERSSDLYPF
jgi:hypothetical protein